MDREQEIQTRERLTRLWLEAEPAVRAYVGAAVREFHDAEDVVQQVVADGLIAAGLYAGGKIREKEQDPWAGRVAGAGTMVGGVMSTITLQQGAGAERIAYYTGWIFSIITAVAASVVVRFTAKNMGFLWNAILNLQETFDNKWKNLLNEWQKGFEDYFPDFKQQNYGKQFQRRLSKGAAPTPGDTNNPKPQRSENDKDISDRLRRAINKAGLMPKEIGDALRASPAAIADLAKLSKEERKNLHAILNRFRGQQDRGVWESTIGVNDPVDEEEVNINQ